MARSAILSVRILGDARGATTAMRETATESGRLSGALGKVGGAMAAAAAGVAVAAGGMAAGIGKAVQAASSLEQSSGAIDAVFQGNAAQMHTFASTAATNLGLTRDEFNQLGTVIGSQLKNGGTAMSELAPKTNELIGVGADLAAMFGGTTADAVGALSSALKGERDPIERYGVSLNQAAIDAKAAELGFSKVGGALSAEANQAATLALIMEQTTAAHGAFGRESNTLAGQLERAKAGWGNVVATVGTAFLPVMTQAAGLLNTHVLPALQSWADSLGSGGGIGAALQGFSTSASAAFAGIVAGVTSFAAGWNGAAVAVNASGLEPFFTRLGSAVHLMLTTAAAGVTAFAGGWNGMTYGVVSSPFLGFMSQMGTVVQGTFAMIGALVGPAIAALGTSLSSAAGTVLQFGAAFSPVQVILQGLAPMFPLLGAVIGTAAGAVLQLMAAVIPLGAQVSGVLIPVVSQIAAAVFPALLTIVQAVAGQLPAFTSGLSMVGAAVTALAGFIGPLVVQLVSGLAPIVADAAGRILPALGTAFTAVASAVGPIVQVLGSVLVPLFSGVIIPAVLAVAQSLLGNLVGAFEGVSRVISGAVNLVSAIFRGDWAAAWAAAGQIVTGAVQAIWNIFNLVVAGKLLAGARAALTGLSGVFSISWQGIVSGVTQALSRLSGGVGAALTGIGRLITGNLTGAQAAFRSAWAQIGSVVLSAVARVRSSVTGGLSAVKAVITSTLTAARSIFTSTWSAMTAATTGGVSRVLSTIGQLPGRVRSMFATAGQWLLGSGRALIDGFASGIRNAIGGAVSAARDVVSRVREFFPFSPAKKGPFSGSGYVTHSGRALGRDFAGSILQQSRTVARATGAMLEAAVLKRPTVPAVRVPLVAVGGAATRYPSAPSSSPSRTSAPAQVVNITVNAGVGDPVEIGREVDRVVRKYRQVVGA